MKRSASKSRRTEPDALKRPQAKTAAELNALAVLDHAFKGEL